MLVPSGRVVLLLGRDPTGNLRLLEAVSEDREVFLLESLLRSPDSDPLEAIQEFRRLHAAEDEAFADYIEGLVSAPGCGMEVKRHASEWFRCRINLERFQKAEAEARQVIAHFALQVFRDDPGQTEFILASEDAEVRVRIVLIEVRQAAA